MKQAIFDKESPSGRIVELSETQAEADVAESITTEERLEALEAAMLELAEVVLNG